LCGIKKVFVLVCVYVVLKKGKVPFLRRIIRRRALVFLLDLFDDDSSGGTSGDDSQRSIKIKRTVPAFAGFYWYNDLAGGWCVADTFDDEIVLEVVWGGVDSGTSDSSTFAWFSVDEDFPSGTSGAEFDVGVDDDSEERSSSFGNEVAVLYKERNKKIVKIISIYIL